MVLKYSDICICNNIKYLKSFFLFERCNESQMHLVPNHSSDVNRENTESDPP